MGRYVSSLGEIGLEDLALVRGKGAHLGQMIRAGFSVPPGFSVKSDDFERFLHEADLKGRQWADTPLPGWLLQKLVVLVELPFCMDTTTR